MSVDERMVHEIVQKVMANMQIQSEVTGMHGVFNCMYKAIEASIEAQKKVSDIYKDKDRFNRMSLINIAEAGVFSSDRAISEYAQNIWKL